MINAKVDSANNDRQIVNSRIDGKDKHYEIMVGVFSGLDSN